MSIVSLKKHNVETQVHEIIGQSYVLHDDLNIIRDNLTAGQNVRYSNSNAELLSLSVNSNSYVSLI